MEKISFFTGMVLLCLTPSACEIFNLTILHTNDVHARFEETSKYGSPCGDPGTGNCFGGIARRYTKVKEIKQSGGNVIFLDAGDQFQGTLWFYVYKGLAASYFMNKLGYDVMALGNHEFDNGPDALVGFLQNVSFPILSANIDTSEEPELDGLVKKATVLSFGSNNEKIGIVGYTTADTPTISSPRNVKFEDEASGIQREVDKLTSQGINKIIAVGHAGYDVDLKLAKSLRDVDVIVGGHTNTFLYTGAHPSNDKPVAVYPTVVTNDNGDTVLVVQDYAFGKYLGNLQVSFSDSGKLVSWGGNPILLDNNTREDTGILNEINEWKIPVSDKMKTIAGKTHVFLDGERSSCRLKECNMGNMLADALVLRNIKHPDETGWSNVSIAVINGGSIRSSLTPGTITVGDVIQVWPFQNTVDIVELKGQHLRLALEHSVAGYDTIKQSGKFLQVSGLIVKYDLSEPDGSRVVSVEARCAQCPVPEYEMLDDEQVYQILLPAFLVNGGDKYDMFKKYALKHHIIGDLDSEIALEYIDQYSPVFAGLERRIQFGNASADSSTMNTTTTAPMTCPPPERTNPCVTGSASNLSAGMLFADVIAASVFCLYFIFNHMFTIEYQTIK